MDPPGRFLKKCPNTGGWEELPLKEAATRTSQAMAYAVRESAKQKKELRSLRSKSNKGAASSTRSAKKPPRLPSYVNVHNAGSVSASMARAPAARSGGGEVGSDADSSVSNEEDGNNLGGDNEISIPTPPAAPSLQQQLLQLQQQSSTASLPANSGTPVNDLIQLLAQAQLQQRQQQQQQQLLRHLLGQFPLGLQTQLPSPSLPSTLSLSTQSQSLSSPLLPNGNSDILRYASALPQGSTLVNLLQQPSLLQNQAQSQSSPLTTQSLLGLMSMLQNQPQPTPAITPQLPWLSQQLNQVQQNQQNQVQQNQLLASLLTTSPNQLLLQQQSQSQPLNLLQQVTLLQQQMAQPPSNSASNSNPMAEANVVSTAKETGGEEEEEKSD